MQEKDLNTGPPVIFDLFPRPTGLEHRPQITEGPVFRPFSYTENTPSQEAVQSMMPSE
jgi:hypothetical protein